MKKILGKTQIRNIKISKIIQLDILVDTKIFNHISLDIFVYTKISKCNTPCPTRLPSSSYGMLHLLPEQLR